MSTAGAGTKSKGPCPPSQTRVAVLNGTATPGLAAQSASQLKQKQYKVGPVGNTSTPFTTSVVMLDPSADPQCGSVIGDIVGIPSEDDDGNAAVTAKPDKVIGNKSPGESELAFEKMTPESKQFCMDQATKLVEAGKSMIQIDLAELYNLQNYDEDEMLAINWCLRQHPIVRRKTSHQD